MKTRIFNYKNQSVMFINCSLDHCYNTADYMIKREKNNGYWKPRLYDDYDQDHPSVESIYDWVEIKDSVTDLVPITAEEVERAYNELR